MKKANPVGFAFFVNYDVVKKTCQIAVLLPYKLFSVKLKIEGLLIASALLSHYLS
jgi:hypothetical protein